MTEGVKSCVDTIQVALRIRPLMPQEIERGCEECVDVVPGEPHVQINEVGFTYTYVFNPHISQKEIFDTSVKDRIEKLFEGYNVTILAYGQTGSGKTYTMGTDYSRSTGDSARLGIIPQAVADIFDFIENNKAEFIFKVSVSFIELYKEQCYDLISGKERSHSTIEIREDVNKAVILPGIREIPVTSVKETMAVLEQGSGGRVTGSTARNQASSRSHAIFTINIYKESRTDKNIATTSKFNLVDLAGSERAKKTKAAGEQMKEGVKINQGLFALGNVISALGDGTTRSFISYRDSKLTRLLQDSLGGNSLTLMVACVSPADYNMEETMSTLRYADRARRIRNKPVINQDPKAAEILRLTNLVNELRVQLLDKLPTQSEKNNEELKEELERERTKYAELLKKHKQLTEYLGSMLIESANLCEKALLAEAAKEKMEKELNQLTEQCNDTIESLNQSERTDDETQINFVDSLKEIKLKLEDLHSVNMKATEELIDHEIKLSFVMEDDSEKMDDDVVLTEDQAALEEEKRAIGQVALNQELQELNRAMAIKASVVQAILTNNKEMLESHSNLKEQEEKIVQLEKEKNELLQQLKLNKSKDSNHNERRNKVSSLEKEISELKKKCEMQANIIKSKEKNEAKITSLTAELQAMKATKVKIIKQMRVESEKFRKLKADNERALVQLRSEDRRRAAAAMAKMKLLHAKQQGVLRRKMEEAVTVNKRLKEALDKQKKMQLKRNAKGVVKVDVIQQYIEQELEVHVSIVEAQKSLKELMDYRALIIKEIGTLRRENEDSNREKIAGLEDDLALRKAQISDLQHKILTADQENKSRTQWDNIQSMMEAKVALKCLFELLVDTKREIQSQGERAYQARYKKMKEKYDQMVIEYEHSKAEYERQLADVKLQSKKNVSMLMALHRGVKTNDPGQACQHLQNVIRCQQERLEQCEDENKKIVSELEELRTANQKVQRNDNNTEDKKVDNIEPTDKRTFGGVEKKDRDLVTTLNMNRIKAQRSRLMVSEEGCMRSCTCRGSCSSRMCDCVRSARSCAPSCRCQRQLCTNRHEDTGKEN